jgi:hypothetical protein
MDKMETQAFELWDKHLDSMRGSGKPFSAYDYIGAARRDLGLDNAQAQALWQRYEIVRLGLRPITQAQVNGG